MGLGPRAQTSLGPYRRILDLVDIPEKTDRFPAYPARASAGASGGSNSLTVAAQLHNGPWAEQWLTRCVPLGRLLPAGAPCDPPQ